MEQYSVLMSVYKNDNADYLILSLKSMINQTLSPKEIVIVKDGPLTTKLENTINKFASKYSIIKLVELKKNMGLGLALNEGLKACQCELIARMDSDDYSMPERCEKQVNAFELNPNLVVCSSNVAEFIDDLSNIVGYRNVPLTNQEIYKFAKRRDPFNHPATMYKKSKVLEVGGYGDYRKNQDTDLWIKLLSMNVECVNLDAILLKFRFDENTFEKRKSWINTKILIGLRYRAWKSGFNSLLDFFVVACMQLGIFLLPMSIQKAIYHNILRK